MTIKCSLIRSLAVIACVRISDFISGIQIIPLFDCIQFSLFLLHINFLKGFVSLVVRHNNISPANVEPGQVFASIFGIVNIFVHHESCCFPSFSSISTIERKNIFNFIGIVNFYYFNLKDRAYLAVIDT